MKCFVVFAALAVIGFISSSPADDAAAITSDASAYGTYFKTIENAAVDIIVASYDKDITKYISMVTSLKSLLETKMSTFGSPGQQYWLGLKGKIDTRTNLTNVWGTTQIKAQTGPYLTAYSQLVVDPMVKSLKDIAKTVANSSTANLKATCYDNNMNMYYSSSMSLLPFQVGWTIDPSIQVLTVINSNLQMVANAPNMQMYQSCMSSPTTTVPDQACFLGLYEANESNLLDACTYYQGNATAGWNDSLKKSLFNRGMNWGWGMPQQPGMQRNQLTISTYIGTVNSCIASQAPPPPVGPM